MKNTNSFLAFALIAVLGLLTLGCGESQTPTPTVTGVTVSPSTPNVVKGENQTFTAKVEGTNSPEQTVTWAIDQTNKNAGTSINDGGVLTVAATETLTTLTVRATSVVDPSKSGTATVTIHANSSTVPTVTNVTVTPSSQSVAKGGSHTFNATVSGTNNPAATVTWSIVQTNKHTGTTINGNGLLIVAAAETLTTLTVRATSTVDATKSGTATVTVTSVTPLENTLHSKWPFYVGAAAPGTAFATNNGQYPLLGHFNVLVAENDMKPESIMPSQWQNWQSSPAYNATQAYRWTEADKLVNYAEANNTKIRGHVLFWHEQIPEVFFRTGNLTSAYVSKEVLYQRMDRHVETVFKKYGGKILWWDVANECVGSDGNPRVEGGANVGNSDGKSGFTAVMEAAGVTGDDRYEWIAEAFKMARKHADENGGQDVKLFLTEYEIENSWSTTKLNGFLRLLDYLITNEAPIDGVGIQGHTRVQSAGGYVNTLSNAIDQIAAKQNPITGKNLVVQVTELDISLFQYDDNTLTLSGSELNSRLQTQATMYRNLFDMFAEKQNEGKFDMVLVWGLADGHSWMNNFPVNGRTDHALLFDRQYKPKLAFDRLITGANVVVTPITPIENPSFTGWGGLGGTSGNTFSMVKEAANTYDCWITYAFPTGAAGFSSFIVSFTIAKTADTGNKAKLIFSNRTVDVWEGVTGDGYMDYDNGSFTRQGAINGNQLSIGINKHDNNNPTADFDITITKIEFHN